MTKAEVAKHIFARNPQLETLHITSDKQAFYEAHQAKNHSVRLKDQSVEVFEKEDKEAAAKAEEAAKAAKAAQDAKDAEPAKAAQDAEAAKAAQDAKDAEAAKAAQDAKDAEGVEVSEAEKAAAIEFLSENVKKVAAKVKAIKSTHELVVLSDTEKAGEDRKGVHNAIADRFEDLHKTNSQKQE